MGYGKGDDVIGRRRKIREVKVYMSASTVSTVVTAFWCASAFAAVFSVKTWPKWIALGSLITSLLLVALYGGGIIAEEFLEESIRTLWRILAKFEGGNIIFIVTSGIFGSFMSDIYKRKK